MNLITPHAFRNILHSCPTTSLLVRPITTACRRSIPPRPLKPEVQRPRTQWVCRRQWSSSAFRAAEKPRDEKVEASESDKRKDETFYMPPPPPAQSQAHPPREEATESINATPAPPEPSPAPPSDPTRTETLESPEAPRHERPLDEATTEEPQKEGQSPIEAVVEEPLPSQRQEQRWQLSKRLQPKMDELLAKAALLSHQVNNYTGTDYSAIERLRRDITEQEQVVKSAHTAVSAAKEAYTASYSEQAASQKEVVGLLERKHSWSAADLERYMSLIRSEHLNEQAVQAAKDQLADAERNLEDARARLEKKERKQYHEEQIWSDTIRRNSTWVTFGLMGLNIFLLLANLVIIEPWRRRRIIREFRSALDEKTTVTQLAEPAVEAQIDQAVEPAEQPLDKLEEQVAETVDSTIPEVLQEVAPELSSEVRPEPATEAEAAVGETALAAGEVLPEEAIEVSEPIAEMIQPVKKTKQRPAPENWEQRLKLWREICADRFAFYKARLQDLFSERQVTLKRVDVTTIALEGAAAGVAVVGFLWVMLNPR